MGPPHTHIIPPNYRIKGSGRTSSRSIEIHQISKMMEPKHGCASNMLPSAMIVVDWL